MSDNLKLFTEKLSKDELLKAELETALQGVAEENRTDAIIAFAKEKGFTLTQEDFTENSEKISMDELENVIGAGVCSCDMSGSGSGDGLSCYCYDTGSGSVTSPGFRGSCECDGMGGGFSRKL